MKVRYTVRAQSDLDAIFDYLDQRSPVGAQSVKNLIERRIAGLAEFPFMAPVTEEPDIREGIGEGPDPSRIGSGVGFRIPQR